MTRLRLYYLRRRIRTAATSRAGRIRRDESGNATIEFCLFLPFFLMLFISSFEMGMLMTRNVMLDRGLDIAVRMVRLGQIPSLDHTRMKQAVCTAAVIIPDCMTQLRLEMRPLDPRNWQNIPDDSVNCVDRANPNRAVRQFTAGAPNQLMVVRACAMFDPIAPAAGLGAILNARTSDGYALVSSAAYVVEPN